MSGSKKFVSVGAETGGKVPFVSHEGMKVLVVDDDRSIRSMLRSIIENQGNEVIGEAGDGQEAIEASRRLKPDLILLDISMPLMGGFPVARYLQESLPELSFIFVTQHRERLYLDEAIEHGAKGYVLKSAAAIELPAAITAFEAGRFYSSSLVR